MARYSNVMIGGMSSCYMNGRQISVIDGEVYVDGIHYVPADGENASVDSPFTPGKMVEHTFEVSNDYDSNMSKGFFDVVFKQVDKYEACGVTGHLPENLIKKMDVRIEDGTLVISMKPGGYNLNLPETPTIYVCNKTLKDVSSSGSGDFTIEGSLDTDGRDFSARTSGSSDFKSGKIKATKANVSINSSGSGDVSISGKTETVEFSIAGSGDIKAGGFKAKSGKASVAGSGDITCNVERLSDRVSGSGDINNRY